jgi:hypothetical protein
MDIGNSTWLYKTKYIYVLIANYLIKEKQLYAFVKSSKHYSFIKKYFKEYYALIIYK